MPPLETRSFIRLGGFLSGVAIGLVLYPPWKAVMPSHVVADIVIALTFGMLGTALADFLRRFLPGQRLLENQEEASLTNDDIAALSRKRLLYRLITPLLSFLGLLTFFPFRYFTESPGFAAFMSAYALGLGLFVGEVLLSRDPRQEILSRIKRRKAKKSGAI